MESDNLLRIAVVTHRLLRSDGQGKINYEAALRLADRGHRVELISSELEGPLLDHPRATWWPAPVPRWLPTHIARNQVFAFRSAAMLRRAEAIEPVDVVLVNGGITYGRGEVDIAMFVHSHWRTVPVHPGHRSVRPNALYQRLYSTVNAAWERRAFASAYTTIALSDQVADSLVNHVDLCRERIEVVPCGVDSRTFHPRQPNDPAPLRDLFPKDVRNGLLALFVGDLGTPRKNLDLVLRAMGQTSGIILAVAGSTRRSVYPAMAESLGLTNRVRFLGLRRDIPELLRQADVFPFPSHYDPWALVVTEAMASGVVPVVGPEVGASCVIESGRNGILLRNSHDLGGLCSSLATMRDDGTLRTVVAAAARTTAERLTWDAMADRYEQILRRAAEARRAATAEVV